MKLSSVRCSASILLPMIIAFSGCSTNPTTKFLTPAMVTFGTTWQPTLEAVNTSEVTGHYTQEPSYNFVYISGPPIGTNSEYRIAVNHDLRPGLVLQGQSWIWVEGQMGKAETQDVVAYAEHTRFVLESAGDKVRVYHYRHAVVNGQDQKVVVQVKKRQLRIEMTKTHMVELVRQPVTNEWVLSREQDFKEDFTDLDQPQRDFLTAVEAKRLAHNVPGAP